MLGAPGVPAGGVHHRAEQIVLAVVMTVERLDRNTRRCGDVIYGGLGIAGVKKGIHRGSDNDGALLIHERGLRVVR